MVSMVPGDAGDAAAAIPVVAVGFDAKMVKIASVEVLLSQYK